MNPKHELGQRGEQIAKEYFQQKGYKIEEINWRFKKAEIDLIAWDGDILVFVEIKTRSSSDFGSPEEFVSPKKEEFMSQAAAAYMDSVNYSWEIRFDIISVLVYRNEHQIRHFRDAFFPGIF